MEIVLHALMAAPKTKDFAEVKARFYLLCELGSNALSAKSGQLKNRFRIMVTLCSIGRTSYGAYENLGLNGERQATDKSD